MLSMGAALTLRGLSEPGECPDTGCNAYMGLQHDVVRD